LPTISGRHQDAIKCELAYHSAIRHQGPPPSTFGLTIYNFVPDNFTLTHQAARAAAPAGSGAPQTPATPALYTVRGDINADITYQLNAMGRTDIASESAPAITQANYQQVANDLMPPSSPVTKGGLAFLKNQPLRTKFWARDLTERHELFHCAEDERLGGEGVQAAQTWLGTRTANTDNEVLALLPQLLVKVGDYVKVKMAPPASEQRAYDDGAPGYRARAQAIKAKGDAKGYVPQPPANPRANPPGTSPGNAPGNAPAQPAPRQPTPAK
jgi:hypothetical protein